MANQRVLVFLPTYNEKDHVEAIFGKLNELGLPLDILFLDDNSPDGTGKILDDLAARHPNLTVIHRASKLGIGSAHMDGIRCAYQRGYTHLITMDCDFTHSPEHIREFLRLGETYPIVVGSRYILDESLVEWNLFRKFLTVLGHALTRRMLKINYDCTGAFRMYRLDQIPENVFSLVVSKGYSFFFESLFVLHRNHFKIAEVPIRLPARTYGTSKMSTKEIFRSVKRLFVVYYNSLVRPEAFLLPAPMPVINPKLVDPQGWDDYWGKKQKASNAIYDLIAAFYRKVIIRPLLNHFIAKHVAPGAKTLHAGAGSGQVDADARERVRITALDISLPALSFYGRVNGRACELLHGSIFDVPSPDETWDAIYNLGVMEHYTEEEIHRILFEFRRVLKNDGKILLFWPPEFGTSVVFLKGVHFLLNRVLGRNVKLHPDEITRVRSRRHVEGLLAQAGFTTIEYYFGPRDFFTYAVIVARKSGPEAVTEGKRLGGHQSETERLNMTASFVE